ncbi:hypothetical protein WCE55_12645 [Luteimonas sp. MJ293]|uniref:hypothetical protein n=1 Tax=Luteimonas sp. MJ146 TaxID=3129240 RepID=UPI0031BAC2EF
MAIRWADYILSLANVPKDRFGMALALLDGTVHEVGDSRQRMKPWAGMRCTGSSA